MSGSLPLARAASLWWRVPLVAATYAAAARLGFIVDVEPGFASSVWPAAGVGAAALLVWGQRLWPGVLVGSYAFNWWLSTLIDPTGPLHSWSRDLTALAIGGGATVQAVLSAKIGRPLLVSGDVLRSVRKAVPFLVFTGPMACLASATIGVMARFANGALPADEMAAHWYTWWLGDSIGVLALAPLTLVALPEAKPRRWRLSARMAVPLFGVLVLIAFAHRATQEGRRLASSRSMAALQDELRRDLAAPIDQLLAVARWVAETDAPAREQFARLFGAPPAFASMRWVPAAPAMEQPPAAQASEPFVLSAHGVDLESAAALPAAQAQARDTGQPSVTPPFSTRPAQPASVSVVVPVFHSDPTSAAGPDGVAERRLRLRGYVTGALTIEDLTTQLARESATLGIATRLADVTDPFRPILLMVGGRPASSGASLRVTSSVGVGGRTWQLDLAPMRPDLLPGETPDGRLLLAGATVLMFLTGLFVMTEAGLGIAVAAEVTHRTAELSSEVIVRRRLEAVARENEARLGLALRGSRLAMWDLEVPTGRVLLSDGWGDIMEQDRVSSVVSIDMLGRLVHPSDIERIRAAAFAALKGTTRDYSVEHRIRTTAGAWKWIHSHGMVTERSEDGRAVRMTGTNADIDERKRSEEAVAAAERRLREVTDGLPGAVYQLIWTNGQAVPSLTFISKWIHELTGLHAEGLIANAQPLFDAVSPAERGRLLESLQHATMSNANTWSLDFRLTHADGREVSIRSQASRVGAGRGTVWNGYFVDIGPALMAERALRAARDQAELANRAKSAFLAAMSHEIRTPMNAILGMAELLEMSTGNAEHRDMLGVITASSQSLLHILNDVLDLSKVEAGHLSLQPVATSLPDVVRSAALTFAGAARQKGLALEWTVDPDIASRHRCDPARLRQVLLNLVGNAVKFTESGSVRIGARLLAGGPGEQSLEITVTDTGIGISPDDRARLFQPFAQVDTPLSRHRGGTGLGLAISKRLVELMEGRITLTSSVGQGTSVAITLTLPTAAEADSQAQSPSTRAAGRLATISAARPVLVVDDNEFNRSVLVRQIAMLGYRAEQAADGDHALARWRGATYGLVLADCQMPGMDGLTLARTIRAEERARGISPPVPIVAWTANVLPEDVEAALAAGMNDVLAKPSALATVERVLDAWMRPDGVEALGSPSSAEPPPLAPGSTPIDEEALKTIMNGDERLTREILDGFRSAGAREMQALARALEGADPQEVRLVAHRLKGQARLIAATGLALVCERIEDRAAGGSGGDPSVDAQLATREWERVRAYLDVRPS